ncbi:glycerol-3-phosphate dehydrogenase [Sphingobium sp. BS19]|uniref:glycerol-3-phosphate dehydrogenase n=1 Tax=Sphingobium sp. BS19 TaxID=3018973 RepID=UPI0022EDD7A3|nr:glycerol-3-phosphate dehydrogenase [Sphingobium sp. BS19]GLI97096.1 glycerol-3-phosphate dehydrogenase [Sphingobium sp. BS19]
MIYNLCVIGGGINGTGIARDAAGRGASVLLLERDDLASGTSSASTKLIHGGLRYLEHYEFKLVRESLMERERLLGIAPHIAWPMRFVLPHHPGLRPRWLLRLGLFLYDHIGGRKLLPATRTIDLRADPAGKPLKPGYSTAFEYSDCWVDDARLVVLNARDAAARGAEIRTRCEVTEARREGDWWHIETRNADGTTQDFKARALVNAGGPWVVRMIDRSHTERPANVRLVRGSHIVTKRLFDHDRSYIFQNADGRIIFAIPYERDLTLIGTTDRDHESPDVPAKASDEEIAYLCNAASEYFAKAITPADVVWTYSGVRPLLDDGASAAQEATRDYVLKLDATEGAAPLLSIFGGKITTYRRLAEEAMEALSPLMPVLKGKSWTATAALPGGDFPLAERGALTARIAGRYPFLSSDSVARILATYGTCAFEWLGDAQTMAALGEDFGGGLTEAEVRYLVRAEWARTADDVLWRRTKMGLRVDAAGAARLDGLLARLVNEGATLS